MELYERKGARVWTWSHRSRGKANQATLTYYLTERNHHSTFRSQFWMPLLDFSTWVWPLYSLALLINLFHYHNTANTETGHAPCVQHSSAVIYEWGNKLNWNKAPSYPAYLHQNIITASEKHENKNYLMPLANIIISAPEQRNRISFFLILHKYNAYFMVYKYRLLWYILFYLFSSNIQPRGFKIHHLFPLLAKIWWCGF